jgi:broad specificity phosphatase PhoE
MLTILLIRSGITDFDSQGRIQGTLDVPLCDEGLQQARTVAAELLDESASITALYAGPDLSAQQTAEIVGERLDLQPKTLKALHNLNQGLWQGMLYDDVKSKLPRVYRQWLEKPETVCPPEGETLTAAADRARQALAKLIKKHKSGVIALVLSQPLACVMRSVLREEHLPCICPTACTETRQWEPLDVPVKVEA